MIRKKFEDLFAEDDEIFDFELCQFTKDNILDNSELPFLFRFSSADYYSIRGIETQSLFLSPIGGMNDVFEGLTCELDEKALKKMNTFSEGAYIKSFSEDKENLLMWAHYADDYKGICVEYDFRKLSEDVLCHLFPVVYSDQKRTGKNLGYIFKDLEDLKKDNMEWGPQQDYAYLNDIMSLFLVKSKAWEYEKEWRIVATYPQINNAYDEIADDTDSECSELYELQNQVISVKNCIRAVYIGPRIEKVKRDHIIEICHNLGGIEVYDAKLSNTRYCLEFSKILDE